MHITKAPVVELKFEHAIVHENFYFDSILIQFKQFTNT